MNNSLKIHISVKFRMAGITFGTVDKEIDTASLFSELPSNVRVALSLMPSFPKKVIFNKQGVLLEVWA